MTVFAPLLAAAVAKLSARTLVLDGEVAIYDQELRPRFDWLREPEPDAVASPPLFMAFDLLDLDRRDLTGRPLRDRRARLEDLVANNVSRSQTSSEGAPDHCAVFNVGAEPPRLGGPRRTAASRRPTAVKGVRSAAIS